jgi:uncharacterized damage-inducible protein DinB
MAMDDSLRYPLGRFRRPERFDDTDRPARIEAIAALPATLAAAIRDLNEAQLDTPYRTGGWTIRQVVHHLPDSHLNAYVRFKLALTEDEPLIKPYAEERWAELPDARSGPIAPSLQLLEGLHGRWVACLRALESDAFGKHFRHPERGLMSLDEVLALYAWHGAHHVAHITGVRKRLNF